MTIVTAVLLAIIARASYSRSQSFASPGTLFSAYWSFLLFALSAAGELYYPLHFDTLAVLVSGTLSFALGASLFSPDPQSPAAKEGYGTKWLLLGGTVFLVAYIPVYVKTLQDLAAESGLSDFWKGLRYQTTTAPTSTGLGKTAYVCFFATLLAFYAVACVNRATAIGYRQTATLVSLALGMHAFTMARTGALILIAGVTGIGCVRFPRHAKRMCAGALGCGLLLFVGVALLLNKGTSGSEDIGSNVDSLSRNVLHYCVGSIVAFDGVVSESVSLPPRAYTFRFFHSLLSSLGEESDDAALVLEYTYTPEPTNVYSVFLPYYVDFGISGVIVGMALCGVWSGWIYSRAVSGSIGYLVLYGITIGAILLSNANDYYCGSLSLWVQACAFACVAHIWQDLYAKRTLYAFR